MPANNRWMFVAWRHITNASATTPKTTNATGDFTATNATGTVGPDLDTVSPKPDFRLATARVTLGKGVMPSFKGQLTDQQIADVAAYVVKSTGGTP